MAHDELIAVAPDATDSGNAQPKYGRWYNAVISLVVWAAGMLAAAWYVHRVDLDPLTTRGVVMPMAIGALAVLILFPIIARFGRKFAAPIAVGGVGAWLGLLMMQALNGTPYGYLGLQGDATWMTATVARYATTAKPVDPFDPTVPAEYPPLFHWTLGRLSLVFHLQPWQMMKYGQIVLISLVPVLAYILWQRLVSPALAVVLALTTQLVFSQPLRAYEVISLATIIPWAIGAFVEHPGPRGKRLPWWVAGIIGGIYFQLYMGYLMFLAPGIIALVVWGIWKSKDRWRYLLRMAGIAGLALLTAAWFLIPFINGMLHYGGDRVSDYWVSSALSDHPFPLPFLDWGIAGTLALIGLFGLVFYWKTSWWAKPLSILAVGAFVYEAVFLMWFVMSSHTGFVHYVIRVTTSLFMFAGLFTIAQATPQLLRALKAAWRPALPVLGVGIMAAIFATGLWGQLSPKPYGFRDAHALVGDSNTVGKTVTGWNAAFRAHAEPLPNGSLPKYFAPGFNVQPIPILDLVNDADAVLGAGAHPRTLAADARLFSFLGWPGYIGPGATSANTFIQWDRRVRALRQLSETSTAEQFAVDSQHTRFGAIDAFLLTETSGGYAWQDGIVFDPKLFDSQHWAVYQHIGELTNPPFVFIVRKPVTN